MALLDGDANLTNAGHINGAVANVSEEERRQYLEYLQDETTKTMIAAMTCLVLFAVVGLIGNSLVLFVYTRRFKRTSTRVFILAIATFDLIANTVTTPGEIYDMFHIWDFDNPPACRLRLFFSAFTTVSAAVSLLAVAVVRYRKVCKPFGRQVTVRQSKIITVAIVGIACLFALPTAVLNGRQTKLTPRPGIHGYECTIDDRFVDTIWPLINTGLLLLLFLSCCVPLIVLYVLIGLQALKHSRLYGVTSAGKSGAATTVSHSSTSGPFTKSTEDSCATPDLRRKKIAEAASREGSDDDDYTDNNYPMVDIPLISFGKYGDRNADDINDQAEMQNLSRDESLSTEAVWQSTRLQVIAAGKPASKSGSLLTCAGSFEDQVGGGSVPDLNLSTCDADNSCLESESVRPDCEDTEDSEKKSQQLKEDAKQAQEINPCGSPEDDHSSEFQTGDGLASSSGHEMTNSLTGADCQRITSSGLLVDHERGQMSDTHQTPRAGMAVDDTESIRPAHSQFDTVQDLPLNQNHPNGRRAQKAAGSSCQPANARSENARVDSSKDQFSDLWRRLVKKKENNPQTTGRPARKALGRTTAMLISITLVYIVSLVPHLAMMFFKFTSPEQFAALDTFGMSMYNLFLRFYYLNSAANAMVYNMCDRNFRKHCMELMTCSHCLR